jgi:hypothetical protein
VLLDAGHRRWAIASGLIVLVATLVYVVDAARALQPPSGGTALGLTFGGAGLALMLYAGVLGARRKLPTLRVGRATTWMKGHIWLGTVSYVLILFHSGFQWGEALTFVLMVLFTIVVVTGLLGLALQQFVPRLLMRQVPLETVYEQIDSVVGQLRSEADALVTAAAGALPAMEPEPGRRRRRERDRSGASVRPVLRTRATWTTAAPESAVLRETYLSDVRPFLAERLPHRNGSGSSWPQRSAVFENLRTALPPALHDVVTELEAICEERRQLAIQKMLHHWLHGWLLVHVPLSMALMLLAVVHAIVTVRY